MMSNSLSEYTDALERLKTNQPIRVPKGTKITNDAVALEAGRGKGSIKKSRPVFGDLIAEIERAAGEQINRASTSKDKQDKAKNLALRYREELEAALAREVSLLRELYAVRKQLAELTGENVLPIRRRKND